MTEESEDSPTFIRQRRNLMVSSLIVIAIWTLELQYDKIRLLDVTAGAPWNFDIGWAVLIWYFAWRLSQCEKPYNVIGQPDGYYRDFIKLKLPTKQELAQATEAALIKANTNPLSSTRVENRDQQTGEIKSWKATKANFLGLNELNPIKGHTKYKLAFEVETLNPDQKQPVVLDGELSHKTLLAIWTWTKAYLAAAWKSQYFTEYLLPYWLGFCCIFYCCWHHISY